MEGEARALGHPGQCPDRLGDVGTDQVLEVLAGERQLGLEPGQVDVDRRFGFGRQRLLGTPALVPQPHQGGSGRRVVRVHRDAIRADEADHAAGERLVEVDAAEVLHLLGGPDFLETGLGLAQDRGVERPAAEVVDRDERADREGSRWSSWIAAASGSVRNVTFSMPAWRTAPSSSAILSGS